MRARLPGLIVVGLLVAAVTPGALAAPEGAAMLLQLEGPALGVAATALARDPAGQHGDAIAARLASELRPDRDDVDAAVVAAMVDHLAATRHPQAVPLAARVLGRGAGGEARWAARTALVSDGSASAQEALRSSARPRAVAPRRWLVSPEPPLELLAIVERPDGLPRRQAAFDAAWAALPADAEESVRRRHLDEHSLLEDARHSALATSADGDRWIVFPAQATALGVGLWAARLTPEGAGPAILLGATAFRPVNSVKVTPLALRKNRSTARLEGGSLIVTHADGATERFALAAVVRDSDADGLSDVVEQRFRLDPRRADTDGDGTRDDVDLSPSAAHPARTERDAIELAIVDQFLDAQESLGPLVIERDAGLDWRRDELTLTMSAGDAHATQVSGALGNVEFVRMKPLDALDAGSDVAGSRAGTELTEDRRAWQVGIGTHGSEKIWHLVLRRLGDAWYVESAALDVMACGETPGSNDDSESR